MILCIVFKLFKIKIAKINGKRIGNILIVTELYLLEILDGKRKKNKFIWIEGPIANKFLSSVIQEKINLFPSFFAYPAYLFGKKIKYFENIFLEKATICGDRDIYGLLDKYPIQINLKDKYLNLGREQLKKYFGLDPKYKIVTLVIRDNSYLQKYFKNSDWSYHDYRDCEINNFKKLINHLISKNYVVIRMGKTANKKFDINNEKFIDYPFFEKKSDFLDIYISYICEFCVTTSAGIDSIPYVARKPMLFVNLAPLSFFWSFSKRNMIAYKWYYSEKNKKILTFKEIYQNKFDDFVKKNEFDDNYIKLIELNENELYLIIMEFLEYIQSKFSKSDIYKKNNIFFEKLLSSSKVSHLHSNKIISTFAISHFKSNKKLNSHFK